MYEIANQRILDRSLGAVGDDFVHASQDHPIEMAVQSSFQAFARAVDRVERRTQDAVQAFHFVEQSQALFLERPERFEGAQGFDDIVGESVQKIGKIVNPAVPRSFAERAAVFS